MYLLDTDILLNLMKRAPPATLVVRLASVPAEEQFTSTIALGELMYGARRLREGTETLLERLEKILLPNLSVLPFDADAARRYGELRAGLEVEGVSMGDAALRMAAIALAHGLTLATGNAQRYQRIPGLSVENWLEAPAPVACVPEGPASVPSAAIEYSLRTGDGGRQAGVSAPAESGAPGIRWIWPPDSPDGQARENNGGIS
jgi:tRNA(fMet)-specific endonuclease VapC